MAYKKIGCYLFQSTRSLFCVTKNCVNKAVKTKVIMAAILFRKINYSTFLLYSIHKTFNWQINLLTFLICVMVLKPRRNNLWLQMILELFLFKIMLYVNFTVVWMKRREVIQFNNKFLNNPICNFFPFIEHEKNCF